MTGRRVYRHNQGGTMSMQANEYDRGWTDAMSQVNTPQRPAERGMTVEQQQELAQFINRNSLENGCDMPDYAIAAYLAKCYQALCIATESHVDWERVMEPGDEDAGLS